MTRRQELLQDLKEFKKNRINYPTESDYWTRYINSTKSKLIVMELDKRIRELNRIIKDNRGCTTINAIIEELKQIKKEALK